uniref:Unannotated protein n=1 Tax=freshwater metagenome TaxID=449393 RepID=A0A6J7NC55_9ZZZZ
MTNVATNSAMNANTVRNTEKKLSPFWISLLFSSSIALPVMVSTPVVPIVCRIRSTSSVSDTLPSPRTTIASYESCLPLRNSAAVRSSKRANVAPPGESTVPKCAAPTRVNSRVPPTAVTLMRSPIANLPRPKELTSTAISVPSRGARPVSKRQKPMVSLPTVAPKVGGPPPGLPTGLPCLSMMTANCWTEASAARTPGTSRICSTSVPEILPRCASPKSCSMTSLDRTYASTFAKTLEKRLSNVPLIVSVNTVVPVRNAVPSMTASDVSNRRVLRASTPFRAIRSMVSRPGA